VLLCPGARWVNKRWPVERFSEVVALLRAARPELRFAVLGGRGDQPLGAAITAAHGEVCLDLTGKTSLVEMMEWIRLAELLVTNDTGPMHVAAALRRPVVALFGPTDPRQTGPYGQADGVVRCGALPCVPCRKNTCVHTQPRECLEGILPARVCAEVLARLSVAPV